jgi:hypothetical protein
MSRGFITRRCVASALGLTVLLVAAGVSASNMGFKLNYGIINALNRLLAGSGISVSTVVDDNTPQKTDLVVQVDLPQNSNMGFKLLLVAIPADGIEVADPDGNPYMLTWEKDTFTGEHYLALVPE